MFRRNGIQAGRFASRIDMKWRFIILLLVTFIGIISGTVVLSRQHSKNDVQKATKVIDYVQTYVPKDSESGGWCWTRSIAASANKKAWRCQGPDNTGAIVYGYDPCFELTPSSVVCNVDPEKADSGFVLNLKEPVPANQELEVRESSYWRLHLASGAVCTPHTGTMTMTNENRFVLFSCDDGTGIYIDGLHTAGEILEAENISYKNSKTGDYSVKANNRVRVAQAWR